MQNKIIGNRRKGSLEELMKKAVDDPKINEIVEGKKPETKGNDILVYSQNDGIYAWPWVVAEPAKKIVKGLGIPLNPIKLCEKPAKTLLMYVDKLLYTDFLDSGIFEITDDFKHTRYCASFSFVDAMCIYNDDVVYSVKSGLHSKVYFILTNEPFTGIQDHYIYCMCEHNGHLFAGLGRGGRLNKGSVYDLDNWDKYPVADEPVKAICSYNGILYAGFSDKIKIIDDRKTFRQRPGKVESMCVVNGKLLDAGSYGIYDTLADKLLIEDAKVVWSISPAPEAFFRKKLRKLKSEFGFGK